MKSQIIKGTIPLWDDKWSNKKLKQKRDSIGALAFDRGFRQKAISPEDLMFPSFAKNIVWNVNWKTFRQGNWRFYAGVDLSSKTRAGTVIQICALDHNQIRHHVRCVVGSWSSPQTADKIQELDNEFNFEIIKIENNAYQDSLIEWIKNRQLPCWTKIQAHTTGRQKADFENGLPGMEVEFSNNSWRFYHNESAIDYDNKNGFVRMYKEFLSYPASTSDTIMALWFCREAMKFGNYGKDDLLSHSALEGIKMDNITQLERMNF